MQKLEQSFIRRLPKAFSLQFSFLQQFLNLTRSKLYREGYSCVHKRIGCRYLPNMWVTVWQISLVLVAYDKSIINCQMLVLARPSKNLSFFALRCLEHDTRIEHQENQEKGYNAEECAFKFKPSAKEISHRDIKTTNKFFERKKSNTNFVSFFSHLSTGDDRTVLSLRTNTMISSFSP